MSEIEDLPKYYKAAMLSISTPVIVVAFSILASFFVTRDEAGARMMMAVNAPLVVLGFFMGLYGFIGARTAKDTKAIIRSVIGIFANGIWLILILMGIFARLQG